MNKIFNLYKGKLTYTISVIGIIWAIAGYFLGYLEPRTAGEIILGALAVFGIRRNM